ncbi:hypothetical protein GCM10027590_32760 [Nocardiopsis nanhaiensis]
MIPEVIAVLRSGYALSPVRLERIQGDQSTTNYRARCTGQDLFVKVYPRGTHLEHERQAIELTRFAGDRGAVESMLYGLASPQGSR